VFVGVPLGVFVPVLEGVLVMVGELVGVPVSVWVGEKVGVKVCVGVKE
jgi:hypothetical protein